MNKPSYRYQRTICRAAEVQGVGYVTGRTIRMRFLPAAAGTGIVFLRSDLGPQALLHASIDNVTGTARRTTLGTPPLTVSVVEHVLATLAALRIDNCILELDGPEVPGMDGSALAFVEALQDAGILQQSARRSVWSLDSRILIDDKAGTLAIHPADDGQLRISFLLDYGLESPIGRQSHSAAITPETFINELASCRTFLLESEAQELRKHGIGLNVGPKDLLVFGERGPIDNELRFANEPARHKVLDVVGDLSLLGCDIRGHIVAYRSGHAHNAAMVRELVKLLGRQQGQPAQRLAA